MDSSQTAIDDYISPAERDCYANAARAAAMKAGTLRDGPVDTDEEERALLAEEARRIDLRVLFGLRRDPTPEDYAAAREDLRCEQEYAAECEREADAERVRLIVEMTTEGLATFVYDPSPMADEDDWGFVRLPAPAAMLDEGDLNADRVCDIASGAAGLHDSTRDLAASLINKNVRPADVLSVERGLMRAMPAALQKTPRWRERYADLPRLVQSAAEKFAPVPNVADVFNPWERLTPPSFPMDCLPPLLAEVVQDDADTIGADVAAVAMAYLAVLAGAAHGQTALRVKRHGNWIENPRLWVMLVGDPSSKKTPVVNAAVNPLRQYEARAMAAYMMAKETWDSSPKDERGPEPAAPTYVLNDTTPEKAADLLSHSPRGTLAHLDELSGWIAGMDRYTNGKAGGANRAFWLQAYQGGYHRQDRISRGTTCVENLSISILGGIQPAMLKNLRDLTNDGLLQRFLPILMTSGGRDVDREPCAVHAAYRRHLTALLPEVATPGTLRLDEAGHIIREAASAGFNDLAGSETLGSGFATFMGKAAALHMRLTLVLHLADPASLAQESDVIPADTVERARVLMEYVTRSAATFYAELNGTGRNSETMSLASFILRRTGDKVTLRDFTHGVQCCRDADDERENLRRISLFVGHGWLSPFGTDYPTKTWTITPGLRERFAERVKIETARCAQAVALIKTAADDRRAERLNGPAAT